MDMSLLSLPFMSWLSESDAMVAVGVGLDPWLRRHDGRLDVCSSGCLLKACLQDEVTPAAPYFQSRMFERHGDPDAIFRQI